MEKSKIYSKDLRIGNIIKNDLGQLSTVINIGVNVIESVPIGETNINWSTVFNPVGVLIDEQKLVNFGFKKINSYRFWFDSLYEFDFYLVKRDKDFVIELQYADQNFVTRSIMYIHTLQNMFFVLVGDDIKYNYEKNRTMSK